MSTRLKHDLLKSLEQHGWTVTRHQGELNYLAWFHEIWDLESRWSPHDFRLFLTFLLDPQPGSPNPFYVITTSLKQPENPTEAQGEPELRMSPQWINDLPQFVDALNSLRCSTAPAHTDFGVNPPER